MQRCSDPGSLFTWCSGIIVWRLETVFVFLVVGTAEDIILYIVWRKGECCLTLSKWSCAIFSMRMMPTMAKLVFLAPGVYLRRSTQWREVQLDLVTCCHWPQQQRMTRSSWTSFSWVNGLCIDSLWCNVGMWMMTQFKDLNIAWSRVSLSLWETFLLGSGTLSSMWCKLSKRGCGWLWQNAALQWSWILVYMMFRDHCLTFGDGICLSGGWDSRRHHIVYCLKKGGMLSDFVKVIMCNI